MIPLALENRARSESATDELAVATNFSTTRTDSVRRRLNPSGHRMLELLVYVGETFRPSTSALVTLSSPKARASAENSRKPRAMACTPPLPRAIAFLGAHGSHVTVG